MSGRTAAQVAGITALTAVTGLLGYAIYFDYQRRNNPEFRKGIKKQHKQIRAAAEARSKAEKERNTKAVREAVREIQMEMPPLTPEAQEAFFQEQVAEGEKLATLGPSEQVNSAKAFYRALRVYPQPVELLTIYQKVVPEPIFELVLEIVRLSPGGPGASGPSSSGPIPPPPQAAASVSDIDEGSGSGSGVGSGTEWERVSEDN